MSADNTHWLSTLVQRAGLGDASAAGLTGDTPIFEAWQMVANSLGISQAEVARAVAGALHLPVADLDSADPAALTFIPAGPASNYGVLPLRATDRELIVATSNPLDFDAEREIAFLSSRRTVFEIAPPDALSPAAKNAYGQAGDPKEALAAEDAAAEAAAAAAEEAAASEAAEPKVVTETEGIPAEPEVIPAEPLDQEEAAESVEAEPSEQEAADSEWILEEPSEDEAELVAELVAEEPSEAEAADSVWDLAEPSEPEATGTELIGEEASVQEASETELTTEEPSEPKENEVEALALGNGEDIDLAPDGGLGAFMRSLLRSLLGVLHRLRALIGSRGESSDSSEPAAGTTVPSSGQESPVEFAGAAPEPKAVPPTDSKPKESAPEAHILIVDDDDGERLIMRTILTTHGFEVSEADDGTTALSLLQDAEDIDGILLDLQMKEMDGLETLETIRKSEKTGTMPVVILTASQNPEDERNLLNAGADDYLRKPVDPVQLIDRIRAVLKRAQLR